MLYKVNILLNILFVNASAVWRPIGFYPPVLCIHLMSTHSTLITNNSIPPSLPPSFLPSTSLVTPLLPPPSLLPSNSLLPLPLFHPLPFPPYPLLSSLSPRPVKKTSKRMLLRLARISSTTARGQHRPSTIHCAPEVLPQSHHLWYVRTYACKVEQCAV